MSLRFLGGSNQRTKSMHKLTRGRVGDRLRSCAKFVRLPLGLVAPPGFVIRMQETVVRGLGG